MNKLDSKGARRLDPSGEPIITFINKICNDIGPRISGSEEEKQAGDLIYNQMSSFCDTVEKEDFKCRPGGFLDFIKITAIFYYIGILSYLFVPILTSIFLIIGLGIYIVQQIFLYEVVDFFFPEISTFHVIGKIQPKSPAKKLVLLSGHHDSAYEFPIFSKLGEKSSYVILGTVGVVVINILIGFLRTVFTTPNIIQLLDITQFVFALVGIVLITIIALFLRSNNVVMGANDNLTAVGAVLECGKYFASHKPEETEIWLISFAGEEHMRGSKRFVSTNRKEILNRDGMLFNMETLSADEYLLATQEPMFLAKHSPKVVDIVSTAAKQVDIPLRIGPLPFAGSDAANFSRKGIHASTIFGLAKEGTPPHWHTLEDTPDKISGPKIVRAAELAIQFVIEVDEL